MPGDRRGSARRWQRAAVFAIGCAIVIVASGSLEVPSHVSRGVEYFPPASYAAATANGTINLSREFDWQAVDGISGAEDTGYPILREAWLLAGGDGSFETVARLHNWCFLASAVAFATAAAWMTRSPLAGWTSLALVLGLRHALRSLLFGAIDNRTLIVSFPLVYVLLVVLLNPTIRRIHRPAGILAALGTGTALAVADLVRHSEGLLAFSGMALACLWLSAPPWRRAATMALVLLGSSLAMHAVPLGVRLFNDAQTRRSARASTSSPFSQATLPYHSPWHSLQISLGRYPNPEGLYYNDLDGFLAAEKAFPDLAREAGPYVAARAYYLRYIRAHPLDWLRSLARGAFEVLYFIPYVTSVGSLPWALGYLPAKEGVVPQLVADPRDVPFDLGVFPKLRIGHGSLLNLRLAYLELGVVEWMVFLASLTFLPAALWCASAAGDVENRGVFLALSSYLALGVGARALVPTYGQALVVAYWATTILALVYLVSAWRIRLLRRRAETRRV
jgi:hypothetical protein